MVEIKQKFQYRIDEFIGYCLEGHVCIFQIQVGLNTKESEYKFKPTYDNSVARTQSVDLIHVFLFIDIQAWKPKMKMYTNLRSSHTTNACHAAPTRFILPAPKPITSSSTQMALRLSLKRSRCRRNTHAEKLNFQPLSSVKSFLK